MSNAYKDWEAENAQAESERAEREIDSQATGWEKHYEIL